MRSFVSCLALAAFALALPAWAGGAAAMQNGGPAVSTTTFNTNPADAPPGVLKFAATEINREMTSTIGRVAAIYPATLPDGRKGKLILVQFPKYRDLTGIAQPDTTAFTLHQGERVVMVRSNTNTWTRVLPYNGPEPAPKP